MSPGGLCSLRLGLTAEVEPPDPPPHPASTSTVAGPAKSTRAIRMAATVRAARHRPVPARLTRGKTSPAARWTATVVAMSQPGVLLVEDDEAIASGLARVLQSQGHRVRRLPRGGTAIAEATPDIGLVILDLGLPDVDGIDVCRALRAARPDLAILILTARDQELDVVAGLDAGADAYRTRPFRLSELLARVRAPLRRSATAEEAALPLRTGALTVDVAARRAWLGERELALRPKEFDLLALLASEAGAAVTRERIMAEVWDLNWHGSTKTLDMHVLSLRQKLGSEAITTLRGVGYRLEAT